MKSFEMIGLICSEILAICALSVWMQAVAISFFYRYVLVAGAWETPQWWTTW